MQFGWVDESFMVVVDDGKGCGDDQYLWVYDGMRGLKWYNNKKK